jgi:hypothetical protein
VDHQREFDLDARQRCGPSSEDHSDSFLLRAPGLQFLSIGFIKSKRSRLSVPPCPSGGKLGMQGGAQLLRTVTCCYRLVDFRVGLGANLSATIGRGNEDLRKADSFHQTAF